MIHKFLKIVNVGTYVKTEFNSPYWNGVFQKYNAIYADNGCGKTTFTQVIKSCQSAKLAHELEERKTLDSSSAIEVVYINENKQQCNYINSKWNYYDNRSDVFDSYYIEDNVYIITLGNYAEPGSYYEVVVGKDAIKTYKEIINLVQKRKRETNKRRNWRTSIKEMNSNEDSSILLTKIQNSQNLSKEIGKKIKELEDKQAKEAEEFGKKYAISINKYLQRLGTELQITKLNKKASKFVYYIKIGSHNLRSDSTTKSLKHTLSEGEKNCLAFAFFLARLELREDLEQRSIVFDSDYYTQDGELLYAVPDTTEKGDLIFAPYVAEVIDVLEIDLGVYLSVFLTSKGYQYRIYDPDNEDYEALSNFEGIELSKIAYELGIEAVINYYYHD